MRSRWLNVAVALGATILLAGSGCPKRKRKKDCDPVAERTNEYLGALCSAWEPALRKPPRSLIPLKLARAALPGVKVLEVPHGPLVTMRPGRLTLSDKEVEGWASFWPAAPKQGAKTPGKGDDPFRVLLGRWVGLGRSLGDNVVKKLRAARGLWQKETELLLAIAASTPARQVVSFLDLVYRAGYKQIVFLVAPTNAPAVPVPPAVETGRDRLTRERGQGPAVPTALEVQRVLKPWKSKGCKAAERLLGVLSAAGTITNCDHLAAATSQVIARCGCTVDERPLLALIQRFAEPFVYVALHRVQLAPQAKPTKVTDGKQPWSELFATVRKLRTDRFHLTGFAFKPTRR